MDVCKTCLWITMEGYIIRTRRNVEKMSFSLFLTRLTLLKVKYSWNFLTHSLNFNVVGLRCYEIYSVALRILYFVWTRWDFSRNNKAWSRCRLRKSSFVYCASIWDNATPSRQSPECNGQSNYGRLAVPLNLNQQASRAKVNVWRTVTGRLAWPRSSKHPDVSKSRPYHTRQYACFWIDSNLWSKDLQILVKYISYCYIFILYCQYNQHIIYVYK